MATRMRHQRSLRDLLFRHISLLLLRFWYGDVVVVVHISVALLVRQLRTSGVATALCARAQRRRSCDSPLDKSPVQEREEGVDFGSGRHGT